MPFDPVSPDQNLPALEAGILKYWREEDIFKRSLERREGGEIFSFYDGPPFATGLPHYGHILAGTIKDVIPRYQTMRGKYVKRRFGWDCHGLPIENLIEKEQGLESKKDIESMGVGAFNDLCRAAVQRYTNEWRQVVERMGRFVDMDWDYRTMDPEYMESIWWVFKTLHQQGLIVEGHKSMHVCPRCQTPLSNFEVTQGYKDIQDYSITAMFELTSPLPGAEKAKKKEKIYALAWTTTGWTLPGNLLLAVHPEVSYALVSCEKSMFLLAKDLIEKVFKGKEWTVVQEFSGKDLIGVTYEPLFPYFKESYKDSAFRFVGADFVTTSDGTGIVHIATGYGDDDFDLGKREKLPVLQHVEIDGRFSKSVTDFAGKHAKPKDDHQSGDKMIAEWLKKHGKLFKAESFVHSYPHCWRCDSPLLNYATSSWFVAVEKLKEKMLASNAKTSWVPGHIKDGRFGKWLEGARDWAISRNRFWGTPLPIWRSPSGTIDVIGSRDELMAKCPGRFTKVIVMRHAESEGNVEEIYQGKEPGTPLTERGKEMAEAASKRVESLVVGQTVKTVYASPLLRTKQTAEVINKALQAELMIDVRLKEVDFGEYEGKHIDFSDLAFIRERRAHKMESGQIESVYHFQGMETWGNIERRVGAFLQEILPKHQGETIVIVTHADIVMNIVQQFTKENPHKIVHQPYPELACVKTLYWDHERGAQMDLHKETVDSILWPDEKAKDTDAVALTLVRHGETDMNKKRILQGGNIDMPLNKVGKLQAKAAAETLKDQQFDVVISSGLSRARETASIIAKELGLPVAATLDVFNERDMGEWTGEEVEVLLKKQKLKKSWKGITPVWLKETPKGGESFEMFVERIRRGQEMLQKEYPGKKVLLVAHGGVVRAMEFLDGKTYDEVASSEPKNAHAYTFKLTPKLKRIDEVLDCWFESGSMPYAEVHFPFEGETKIPPGFPADFIAEGLDQTRGWFYTLMVLSSALFECPAFKHCIVNGIVLAEDGKKMSKKLKNYPEPTEIVEKYGADAVRFALMSSPAVRGEDLRFSEKFVQETVRSVLLPLWNAYRLFVTYANAVDWKPSIDFSLRNAPRTHMLDAWIVLKTQSLINRVTSELDTYDLSATCGEIASSIDDLTNWYVRLSRRRLAGQGGRDNESTSEEDLKRDQNEALDTLYRVLIANCQLLAPFCPFISEAMYLNLVPEDHGSVHFTDWPQVSELTQDDEALVSRMDATRTVVRLGLALRSEGKIRVRQPLASVTFTLPPSLQGKIIPEIVAEELNVKKVMEADDATALGKAIVQVDARKVGPRLGSRVQEIIKAGKAGQFTVNADGTITILGEVLSPQEAKLSYLGKEGSSVAADRGIVVTMDTVVTPELKLEGEAREFIHAVQQLRKDTGLEFGDTIVLFTEGADDIMKAHATMVLSDLRAEPGDVGGKSHDVKIDERAIKVRLKKK